MYWYLTVTEAMARFTNAMFIELAIFSGIGFLIAGIDELIIDLIWIVRAIWRRLTIYTRHSRAYAADLAEPNPDERLAIFIPAWDESAVIAPMLRHALEAYHGDHVRIFVGCYPNDPATIEAVRSVGDDRIEAVICSRPGKTTKADCLNALWSAASRFEEGNFQAVILHDSEDLISPYEARVIVHLLPRFGLIQLPVVPLVDRHSRWISGHYCDEFAESHGKSLIVREALGTSLPLAGVGCAIRIDVLKALSESQDGRPFDVDSLTEDYETGVRLSSSGATAAFVRMQEQRGGALVATRAHFPDELDAAVQQKARWIIGIAIAGWDRLGWTGNLVENWMRLRDRQGLFAGILLFIGYLALIFGASAFLMAAMLGRHFQVPDGLIALSSIVTISLVWRLGVRAVFVGRIYGLAEAFRSIPRAVVANGIAILAARRAAARYLQMARNGHVEWDKTAHKFPDRAS